MSTNSLAVFIGPTLFSGTGFSVPSHIDVLDPVQCGDIMHVLETRDYRALLIIDGYYEQVPAIWHKEILWALSQGVHVWGAGSIGALRAAELDTLGVRGIGEIYQMYHDRFLDGDDEVCVVHRPKASKYEPLCEALVNVRKTLSVAQQEGVLSETSAGHLLQAAQKIFYADRTWEEILQDAVKAGANEGEVGAFTAWLPTGRVNLKHLDAVAAIEAFSAADATVFQELFVPSFTFEMTRYLDRMFMLERERFATAEATTEA